MKNIQSMLLAAVCALALALPLSAGEEVEARDGEATFQDAKCSMCHGVGAAGIEAKTSSDKMKGPDLSGFETKATFADVAAYLKGEAALDGKKHKRPFKGTDEELQAILDWLGSLEATE